ncbi:MAG TPA: hypothetical protein VH744_05325 [Terriglobales bacterium]
MGESVIGTSLGGRLRAISSPTFILALTAVHLAVGVLACLQWLSTGNPWWVDAFFRYPGALFFLLMASLELALSIRIWREFEAHETLGIAWSLIALSAACHTLSVFFAQILGQGSRLNPLLFSGQGQAAQVIASMREFGVLVGGPLHMLVLAQGLFLVLRVYKRLGLLVARLKLFDYALLGIVGLYTLVHLKEVEAIFHEPASLSRIIGWASDPLLAILVVEAVFLRRSVAEAGWGLISKCWGAFCAAIFLTSLGDMGIWAVWRGYLPPPFDSLTWYLWFPASAAYALGPAYQAEALRTAQFGLRNPSSV